MRTLREQIARAKEKLKDRARENVQPRAREKFNSAGFKAVARTKERVQQDAYEANRKYAEQQSGYKRQGFSSEEALSEGLRNRKARAAAGRMKFSEYSGDKGYASSLIKSVTKSEAQKNRARRKIIDPYKLSEKVRKDFQKEREYKANQKIIEYENRQAKYDKTLAGRISNKLSKAGNYVRNPALEMYKARGDIRPRLARDPYSKAGERNRRGYAGAQVVRANRQTSSGVQSGAVGRPYGTFQYRHPVTGQPIGVYEYRKILSAQLRNERIQVQGQSGYSPQQLNTLQRIQAQQRYNQSNVEGQAIPDTYGQVNTRSIHNEADAASHLFD